MSLYSKLQKEIDSVSDVHPNLLSEAKERAEYMDDTNDKGIVNDSTGSSVLVRENGDITLTSSLMSQYKVTASGHTIEESMESHTRTVRKVIEADEIVINNHKLNPALYELSDMRNLFGYQDISIGNLTVNTTVLVKAWENTLQKWVLIRRPARIPLFSPVLNLPDCPENMNVDTDIKDEILKASQGGSKG